MHGPPQNHIRNHPKPPETNHPLTCRDLWAPPQWAFNFPETWQNASLGKTLVWQDASTFLFVFAPTGSPLSFGLFYKFIKYIYKNSMLNKYSSILLGCHIHRIFVHYLYIYFWFFSFGSWAFYKFIKIFTRISGSININSIVQLSICTI